MDNQHIKNLVINLPSGENLGVIDLVLEAGAAMEAINRLFNVFKRIRKAK